MRLSYHPAAEAEIVEATLFYEECAPGLGERLWLEVENAAAQILAAPQRWPLIEPDLRRYLLPSFPYALYYQVDGDTVEILVVKHHSRHPDYWRNRLET